MGLMWEAGAAILGTAMLCALALAPELVAPLERPTWRSRLIGLKLSMAKAAAVTLILPGLQAAYALVDIAPWDFGAVFGTGCTATLGAILAFVILFDFLSYWHHRFLHAVLWPIHATHHAIRELSALNSYAHFAEKMSEFMLIAIPLSLVRWDGPAVPATLLTLLFLLNLYIHSPTRAHLGPLAAIFVDPRFHRIHHSLEERHFDRNFGILLTVWDHMFGTAHVPAADEWPDTGLDGAPEAQTLVGYTLFPLRFVARARRGGDRVRPATKSPAWIIGKAWPALPRNP